MTFLSFSPGHSMSGDINIDLKRGWECVLYIAIFPTVSALSKAMYRVYEKHDREHDSKPNVEIRLSENNDIQVQLGDLIITIPVLVARRYFSRFIMLNAFGHLHDGTIALTVSLDNKETQSRSAPYKGPTILTNQVVGGDGLAFYLRHLMLFEQLNPCSRKKLFHFFEQEADADHKDCTKETPRE